MFSREVIGLQIGPHQIAAIGMRLQAKPQVVNWAIADLPEGTYVQGGFSDYQMIGTILKDMLGKASPHSFGLHDTYLTLPEELIFRKIVEVPVQVGETDLSGVIGTEIREYLPVDIDLMEFAYQRMSTIGEDTPENVVQYAVVAAEKRIVQDHLAVCAVAKLPVRAIDTFAAALARASVRPRLQEAVLVANWDSDQASVSLTENGRIWATGLIALRPNQQVDGVAEAIADEIDHVVKFYVNRTGAKKGLSKLYLNAEAEGDQELTDSMLNALQKQVNVHVEPVQPVVTLPSDLFTAGRPVRTAVMGALGAALYPLYELA